MRCYESAILRESVELVRQQLGRELEDMTVERAVFGLFFSGVKLSTGQGGLCFTPVKEMPQAVCCPSSAKAMPLSGRLKGRPVKEYLDDIFGDNILRRTLGIAALNALSMAVWEREVPAGYEILTGMRCSLSWRLIFHGRGGRSRFRYGTGMAGLWQRT